MFWPLKALRNTYIFIFALLPLVFLPFTSELFEFNKMIGVYLATLFVAFFWAIRMFSEHRIIFRRSVLDIPLLLFLAIQLLSLAFSIDPRTSFLGYYSRFNGGFLSLFCYSFLYWAYISNLNRKSTLIIVNWSLISAAVVALWGVAEHFGIDASIWVQDVKNRVFSTLGQPNWLAAYLVALIFIPLSNLFSAPSPEFRRGELKGVRLWNIALTILLFITLLYTKSRSGLLAFGISSVVFWSYLLVKNHFSKSILSALAVAITIVIVLLLAIQNPIRDLLISQQPTTNNLQPSGTVLESGGTESGAIRKIVWTGAIGIWQSSPKNFWLGSGPETFAMAYYSHRPAAHNATSEWELLYNKAHNEFLNYLSTTGLLGLITYASLLLFMAYVLSFRPILNLSKESGGIPSVSRTKGSLDFVASNATDARDDSLRIALFAGWLSISITNFWGFSVVMVQLFLFLFPAFVISLNSDDETKTSHENPNFIVLILLLTGLSAGLYFLSRYYLADIHYAAGQKSLRAFTLSQNPQYALNAYNSFTQSYKLNPADPPISSELGNAAAYLSLLLSETDATGSAEFAHISQAAANQSIAKSPSHPNYYKSAARSLIILGTLDNDYFHLAEDVLASAQSISPTDPRLPYYRGIIAKFLEEPAIAQDYFKAALTLKPDFGEAQVQLQNLASPSAQKQ